MVKLTNFFGIGRITFIFVHVWLAFVHFWHPIIGEQFFRDEAEGRKRRLKRAVIKKKFSNIKVHP